MVGTGDGAPTMLSGWALWQLRSSGRSALSLTSASSAIWIYRSSQMDRFIGEILPVHTFTKHLYLMHARRDGSQNLIANGP